MYVLLPLRLCIYTATHRNFPQHTATHRNTPQHTATHCRPIRGITHARAGVAESMHQLECMCVSREHTAYTMQHTATHPATHCRPMMGITHTRTGVVESMRQLECMRFSREREHFIASKCAHLQGPAASAEWMKNCAGSWLSNGKLRDGSTPESCVFTCNLPLSLRFPVGSVVTVHGLSSKVCVGGRVGG